MVSNSERPRVLLSAYACEPGRGSEPGVGWNMAKALSHKVRLSVVTRANNRLIIERSEEAWVKQVDWLFYDPPKWLTWWKRGGRGVQLFYILWQFGVFFTLRKLAPDRNYDIVHHVTFGKYWVPSLLPMLGVPFVFGSVGGGEYTPDGLKGFVGKKTLSSEKIKRVVAELLTKNPLSRALFRRTALAYAATEQTKTALLALGVKRVELLPQSGISSDELQHYQRLRKDYGVDKFNEGFVVCSAARLIPWKGVDLAIMAFLRALPNLPTNSKMKVASDGPELERLKVLVKDADAEDKVQFLGRLDTLDDVYRLMIESDVLLHAATSEAFGQACAESLGLGTPVICWDWAGPGLIVANDCGRAVPPCGNDPIGSFADAIASMCAGREEFNAERENACVERVRQRFLWGEIGAVVRAGYESISR